MHIIHQSNQTINQYFIWPPCLGHFWAFFPGFFGVLLRLFCRPFMPFWGPLPRLFGFSTPFWPPPSWPNFLTLRSWAAWLDNLEMPKASEIVKSSIFDPPGGKLCAGLRPAPKGGGGSKGWLYNLRRLWHLEIVAGGPAALPIPNATGPPRITGRLNDTLPFVEFFPTSAFNCQLIEGGWSRPSRYNLLFSEFFSTRIFSPKNYFFMAYGGGALS